MESSSIGQFVDNLSLFLTNNPEVNDQESDAAKAAFLALSRRSFQTPREAYEALANEVSRVQSSSNRRLAEAVQQLFNQTLEPARKRGGPKRQGPRQTYPIYRNRF